MPQRPNDSKDGFFLLYRYQNDNVIINILLKCEHFGPYITVRGPMMHIAFHISDFCQNYAVYSLHRGISSSALN